MIVFDTDIISAFAKAGALNEILGLFNNNCFITESVKTELMAAADYGYEYAKSVINSFAVIGLEGDEIIDYKNFLKENNSLGEGELQSIAVCKHRGMFFASFDKKAIEFAEENRIKTLFGKTILRAFWERGICSRERVREIIKLIEEKDYRVLDTDGVFD